MRQPVIDPAWSFYLANHNLAYCPLCLLTYIPYCAGFSCGPGGRVLVQISRTFDG